jgi:hypothetical protein
MLVVIFPILEGVKRAIVRSLSTFACMVQTVQFSLILIYLLLRLVEVCLFSEIYFLFFGKRLIF